MEKFIEHIEDEVKRLYATFSQQPLTEFTDVLKREHEAAEKCHISLKEFNNLDDRKVRDHRYYTGLYRGASLNNCNLQYRMPDHIPIVFPNLSSYNAHLFIKELGKKFNRHDIGVIAGNEKKYISFNVKLNAKLAGVCNKDGKEIRKHVHLSFRDICRSMESSLHKLAGNLCGTSEIQCNNCKGNMELVNISGKYIALLKCKRCKT